MEEKKPKYLFRGHNTYLVNHLFQYLLVVYLVLLLLEQLFTAFVSQYINLNYLLLIVIIVGILDVFSEHPIQASNKKPKPSDYIFILTLGVLGAVIIKFKTSELGILSWLISIIAGILIILLSILVLEDEDEQKY